jgi:hypothetical protein
LVEIGRRSHRRQQGRKIQALDGIVNLSSDDGDRTARNVHCSELPALHRRGCAEDGEAPTWGKSIVSRVSGWTRW